MSHSRAQMLKVDVDRAILRTLHKTIAHRAGFVRTQRAYDEAVTDVFAPLDKIETHLPQIRFLVGGALSEADIRLFRILVRFDVVYKDAFETTVRLP